MAIGSAALLGGVASGIYGAVRGSQISAEQAREMSRAYAQYHGVEPPSIEELAYKLEQGAHIGDLVPESFETIEAGPSAMEQVQVDPSLKQDQMDVLERMKELSEGGLSEADKAAMREAQRDVAAGARSRKETILREMAQRGTLGSGAELAAQLGSSQAATEQAARASDEMIRQAQARSLSALTKSGAMAGDLRAQEYGEQTDLAKARDVIAESNLANKRNIMEANIRARNLAQAKNLAARQAHEYDRAKLANKQAQMDADLKREQYQNQLAMADRRAKQIADSAKAKAAADSKQAGAIGGLIGSGMDLVGSFGSTKTGTKQAVNKYGETTKQEADRNVAEWGQTDDWQQVKDPNKFGNLA